MAGNTLEFVDPSGLNDIEKNIENIIKQNERLLEKQRTSKKSNNLESGLEEFSPSLMEREMENMKPCIEKTANYLNHLETRPSETNHAWSKIAAKHLNYQNAAEENFDNKSDENYLGSNSSKTVLGSTENAMKSSSYQNSNENISTDNRNIENICGIQPCKTKSNERVAKFANCQNDNKNWLDDSCVFVERFEAVRVCLGQCICQEPVEKVDDIQPGDHLVYQRSGYQHHAIVVKVKKVNDLSGDITVIHKSGDALDVTYGLFKYVVTFGQSSPKGCLKEETFADVNVRDVQLFIVKYKTYPYTREQIIQRARDELSKSKSSEYNLANNNCEHIVTWCVTGEWYSDQINSMWIGVRNKFKPFCEETASMEKVEHMRQCDLICDECYSKCKSKRQNSNK